MDSISFYKIKKNNKLLLLYVEISFLIRWVLGVDWCCENMTDSMRRVTKNKYPKAVGMSPESIHWPPTPLTVFRV